MYTILTVNFIVQNFFLSSISSKDWHQAHNCQLKELLISATIWVLVWTVSASNLDLVIINVIKSSS